ncbi:MAG: 2-amino-4-hydroxy-6-hydroxymethyldihydropteridine diphosphokinase [Wenzhouxiangellaceae bacterium]
MSERAEESGLATVYLGLGSNVDAERHLRSGIAALRARFREVRLSPVYRSRAVGFEGDDFLNACCRIRTGLAPAELKDWLSELERRHGRRRGVAKFSDRTLDIDILLHGDRVGVFGSLRLPRPDILQYAHVLKPLSDLAPDLVHPETGRRIAEHWAEFDGPGSLWRVDFDVDEEPG